MAWSCNGAKLASGSVDQTVRVWSLDESGRATDIVLTGHQDSVDQLRWDPHQPDVLGTALRLLLVLLAAAANVRGANVVGLAAGLLMLAVTLPFAWLTIAAYASPNAEPLAPLAPSKQNWPTSYSQGYFLCNLILWNTCGYDSAGMVAAEVVDGRRTYPRALAYALALTTLIYLLPLAACAAASSASVGGELPEAPNIGDGGGIKLASTAPSGDAPPPPCL